MSKITLNGKALGDCPKCKSQDSLYVSSVMKWGRVSKWIHVPMCVACDYEGKAK
jgi:hypothetical protein